MGMGLALSLGVHLLLVGLLAFWPGWGFNRRQIFAPTYSVQLVGAPALTPPAPRPALKPAAPSPPKPVAKPAPQPVAQPKPAPKPKPTPKEAVGTKKETAKPPRIKRQEAAPDTSQELDKRIARIQREVKRDRSLENALTRLERKVESRQDQGTGAYGVGAPSASANQLSVRFQIYYTELWQTIRRHWVLPEALVQKTKGLEAVLVLRIMRNGALAKVWMEKGSGNDRFDQSALRAVERAAPFPPLPSGLREATHEVGVRFRAEDLTG